MVRKYPIVVVAALLFVTVAAVTGCDRTEITFVSEGASYTLSEVEEVHAAVTPPPSVAGRPVADAPELRRDALTALRARGGEPAELADFLTELTSGGDRSVPYYGEAATVDGKESWVVLEAWGAEGAALDSTRLWVFERGTGAIVYSSARR